MFNLVFLAIVQLAWAKVDFCEDNQLPSSKTTSNLQFTKELSVREYAVDSKFKSLHCCAKGYLSIEWFKDGRPYPFPSDVSSFILYPESENQTVYTKNLRASDAGNYTCRIHNDTDHTLHNTELKVFDSTGYMENPLATYQPPPVSVAFIGEQTRLFCEAFVGHIDLPDATSEVTWNKMGNASLEGPHISMERVQRENGQIVGAYLIFDKVDWSDLGTYICTISNTGDQKISMETELKVIDDNEQPLCLPGHMTIILFLISLSAVFIFIFYFVKVLHSKNTPTNVWEKVHEYSPFHKKKKSGLVVLYAGDDIDFLEHTFLPLLKKHSNYFAFPQKVDQEEGLSDETRDLCKKVQRAVIILSRNMVKEWNREGINVILEELIMKEPTYVVVLLEALPESPNDSVPYFRKLHNKFTLLPWDDNFISGNHPFWTKLSVPYPLQRMEHRTPSNILDILLKRSKRSSEVHV